MMTPANGPLDHDTDRYCGGPKRQSEGTCTRPAGWGTGHLGVGRCKLHGGSTHSHTVAGQTELARRAAATYGLPRDVAPGQALLEEIARTAGHIDYLAERVRELDSGALVWGTTKQEQSDKGTTTTEAAAANIWLELYRGERKHLVDVCKAALAAGIAERQIQVAEQLGHLIADVLRKVLSDPELGLTEMQRRAVPAVARRHLTAV